MTTVRIPPSMAEQIDQLRGDVPRDRFVRRMLESVLNTSASSGGGPASAVIPGESGRGAGKAEKGVKTSGAALANDVVGAPLTEPASAPSRASARRADGRSDARTASFRSASRARKVPAGPQASPPSDGSSSASQGREGEAGSSGGAGAALPGQTTVDEMLASCPNCAGEMQDFCLDDGKGGGEMTKRCEDCGYVREPS
jgi:hypothetical protein